MSSGIDSALAPRRAERSATLGFGDRLHRRVTERRVPSLCWASIRIPCRSGRARSSLCGGTGVQLRRELQLGARTGAPVAVADRA